MKRAGSRSTVERRRMSLLAALFGAAALIPPATGAMARISDVPSESVCVDHDRVEDRYIVTMRPEQNQVTRDNQRDNLILLMEGMGADIYAEYRYAFSGFAIDLDLEDATQLQALQADPNVARIDSEFVACLDGSDAAGTVPEITEGMSWGLDRIDQRQLPLDDSYTPAAQGTGVRVFVIDSGIRADHVEFGSGQVDTATGRNFAPGVAPTATGDCNGHGTHVAGTIGSSLHGVAPGVSLIPIRVFSCANVAAASVVLSGIDYVAQVTQATPDVPTVVNMSMEGDGSQTPGSVLNAAVAGLIGNTIMNPLPGVPVVVSAGSHDDQDPASNPDACLVTPASVRRAITVGATTIDDKRWSNSNAGNCVDLFAPGVGILSTSWRHASAEFPGPGVDQLEIRTGTSMSVPHVTGLAAQYLGVCAPIIPAPNLVEKFIKAQATAGLLEDVAAVPSADSPDLLGFTAAPIPEDCGP